MVLKMRTFAGDIPGISVLSQLSVQAFKRQREDTPKHSGRSVAAVRGITQPWIFVMNMGSGS